MFQVLLVEQDDVTDRIIIVLQDVEASDELCGFWWSGIVEIVLQNGFLHYFFDLQYLR